MKSFDDPKGGYGSDLYAYLEPFVVNDGQFDDPQVGKQATGWFGWHNRYDIEAVRPSGAWTIGEGDLLHLTRKQSIEARGSIDLAVDYIAAPRKKTLLAQLARIAHSRRIGAFEVTCDTGGASSSRFAGKLRRRW